MKFWEYKKVDHTPFMDLNGDVFIPSDDNSTAVYLTGGDFDGTYWPMHNSWSSYLLLRSTRDGEGPRQVKMYVFEPTDSKINGVPVMEFKRFGIYSPEGKSPCSPDFKEINHNNEPNGTLANYEVLAYRFSKESSNE